MHTQKHTVKVSFLFKLILTGNIKWYRFIDYRVTFWCTCMCNVPIRINISAFPGWSVLIVSLTSSRTSWEMDESLDTPVRDCLDQCDWGRKTCCPLWAASFPGWDSCLCKWKKWNWAAARSHPSPLLCCGCDQLLWAAAALTCLSWWTIPCNWVKINSFSLELLVSECSSQKQEKAKNQKQDTP